MSRSLITKGEYTLPIRNTRQKVNNDVKKWEQAIQEAKELLVKVENRAARLKGAIKTFEELRDHGHDFKGPDSAAQI
jgi:hypothetical protein